MKQFSPRAPAIALACLGLASSALWPSVATAEQFKCKAADGKKTVYQDTPCRIPSAWDSNNAAASSELEADVTRANAEREKARRKAEAEAEAEGDRRLAAESKRIDDEKHEAEMKAARQAALDQAKPKPVAPQHEVAVVGPEADQCRDTGSNIAAVYLANIKQAASVNLMASQMMGDGCRQATAPKGEECRKLCEDGFRWQAKQFLK